MEEEYNQLSGSDKEQVLKNSKELGIVFSNGGMGGEIEENATTILGIACDKTQFMGTTMYTIHNSDIALKTETNIMGMVTLIEATSIIKDVAPQRYFQHPQGITAVIDLEADAISRSMAEETILKLNDPEASEKVLLPGATHQLHPAPEEQQDMEKAIEALKNIFEN